ncbi:MAG: bifunctional folylpolyglutamate synthase/dihydrofolate synthase [Thermodesulfobacteria bacterium]|nr:bifunctional folylpolyglutamate synthase/dihydrofolate synthase [Thermodesulfobacteriota bacterium]
MLSELLNWLSKYEFHGIKPGLARTIKLLKLLGNPHKKFSSIHIAGTNGKGSTGAMVSSILSAHGLKTGFYSSPHFFKLNERFKVNNEEISDEELADLLLLLKKVIKDMPVTYFEITTALAFLYFAEKQVDIAIVECGLGGRLDSTNVILPEVSIITSIGKDHTKYLGDSLESIAFEKACIIKRNKPCVIGKVPEVAYHTIKNRAKLLNSPAFYFGKDFFVKEENRGLWSYIGKKQFSNINLSLKGDYQKYNLGCALKTLEILEEKSFLKIEEDKLKLALSQVNWKGRYEKISFKGKKFLIDVAHNLEGAIALKNSLKSENFNDFVLIMGMSNEDGKKPFLDVLNVFLPYCNKVFLCDFESPRKIVSIKEWKKALTNKIKTNPEKNFYFFSSPYEAFKTALNLQNKKFLITGSIYFVKHWLKLLEVS